MILVGKYAGCERGLIGGFRMFTDWIQAEYPQAIVPDLSCRAF